MNRKLLPLLLCATGMLSATGIAYSQADINASPDLNARPPENLKQAPNEAPPMLGIHWSRDFVPNARAANEAADPAARFARRSPNMTYHGGVIMPSSNTKAIFWGTSWGSNPGDKITGMDSWYKGFGNSNYAKTSTEYTGSNGKVGPNSVYGGHVIDTTASATGSNTTTILNEVCKVITNPDPTGNGYYAVYTDRSRGSAGYCAYHSVGTCNGIRVQFAYFFKL